MSHALWTFQVIGGEPVAVQPPGNPILQHDGGMTLAHLMLTNEQAQEVVRVLEDGGSKVKVRQAEKQTEEQLQERRALLGKGKEEHAWPTPNCPTCYWFDPREDYPCGYEVWTKEVVDQSLASHEAARDGLKACPTHGETDG